VDRSLSMPVVALSVLLASCGSTSPAPSGADSLGQPVLRRAASPEEV
jgi:hypothetical protein